MEVFRTRVEANGTIHIPSQILEKIDISEGQEIDVEIEKKSLHISLSASERIKKAQAKVRKYVPESISLVDELIEDRQYEAKND